ncbi:L,D-transpeptidase [Chthonobacter albigriseus]|uniref:L,D-transpeptidase n=1 Tax=Chthonobacter albigriseus TaxID=1683161 RepID=UPI0015EFBF72|nr:L,D-transpeptidase [Chthonobacter albigriseus]
MRHILLAVLTAAVVTAAPAAAQSGRYVTPPPLVLSPNLTDPWVMQLAPGRSETIYEPPAVREQVRLKVPNPADTAKAAPSRTREIDPEFLPTVVDYDGGEPAGTVVIDTNTRHLYLVEAGGTARRYGVGVGRPGFEWAGEHRVSRKAEWPDWHPPAEMRQRQPDLPVMMVGGPKNPLGARALYLGSSLYRIHGTSEPWTIGHAVSSGCIRMRNEDVTDLYERVPVGARVIVR